MSEKKKPKRRFFSRQFETIFFVILILSVFSIFLFVAIKDIFPNNGGYTRNIFFIKPTETGEPGYFIAIDEINPTKDNIPVDWILHGRGNLTVFNNNQSAVWAVKSYLDPDDVIKLYAIFIEPRVTISESVGPFYPTQSYVDNPIMIPYIKARPTQAGPTRFLTILFPLNASQTLPNITTDSNAGVTYIGANDLILSQDAANMRSFDNFTTNAEMLFLRQNNSEISSFILRNGRFLSHQNRTYLDSEQSLSLNLGYQSSNISGMLWINSPTIISLWVPKTPKKTVLNGENLTVFYNPATQILQFPVWGNGSLLISFDPVKSWSPSSSPLNLEKTQPPPMKDLPLKNFGSHPYLYFNETTLTTLRNRVLTENPWQGWFSRIETNAINHLADVISTMGANARFEPTLNLAFTGVIRENLTYINKAKEFLQSMDQITDYDSHLSRGRACSHYSVAYDMIYQDLSVVERAEIAAKLGNHTLPLIEKMPVVPRNNHIGIVASGIGLAGLVLDKSDWVTQAISGINGYFTTSFAAEGGNYEGYSYAGYFLESGLKFFYGLQNVGEKNYFADPKFLSFINNTINSLTPLASITLFEDSNTNPQNIEGLLWAAGSIYPYMPLLSNYSQWVYEKRLLNDALSYDGTYLNSFETSNYNGLVTRVCMYSMNITAVQPPLETIIVWPDSGLAFFRSDWGQDALYLSITCKNKSDFQYHAHYDENSFEIWAYGAWLATNPGYPGFGHGEYDWITSTEASNTILLNNEGQQQVNGEGFQEYFVSSEIDGVVASANSIYSSPGNFALNNYFLGVIIFIFTNLAVSAFIIIYLRRRGYKTNIVFIPQKEKPSISSIKSKNLVLKTHLIIGFGLIFGVIISLASFFLFSNPYLQAYTLGKHSHIVDLMPILEISLLIIIIPLLILVIAFKFKMQKSIVRRIAIFSSNLKGPHLPQLKDSIKLSYFPQTFFLLIFIPLMMFFYVPLLQNIVHHICTEGGSLIDIQNYIISTLDRYILLFALTFLLYLPFKIYGIYLGGRSISDKTGQPTSDGVLMLTASYLLTLTLTILVTFYFTLLFFYILNFLGVSFFVSSS